MSWDIGSVNRGKKLPLHVRRKISETRKKKYIKPWNYGIPRTEQEKKNISESRKGSSTWNKGKKWSKKVILKMSFNRRGIPAWNKGIPRTPEEKDKIRTGALRTWILKNKKVVK